LRGAGRLRPDLARIGEQAERGAAHRKQRRLHHPVSRSLFLISCCCHRTPRSLIAPSSKRIMTRDELSFATTIERKNSGQCDPGNTAPESSRFIGILIFEIYNRSILKAF
jgi:hypothetical protein